MSSINNKSKQISTVKCIVCYHRLCDSKCDGCEHEFCYKCLHRWCKRKHNCPICRKSITKIYRKNKTINIHEQKKKSPITNNYLHYYLPFIPLQFININVQQPFTLNNNIYQLDNFLNYNQQQQSQLILPFSNFFYIPNTFINSNSLNIQQL